MRNHRIKPSLGWIIGGLKRLDRRRRSWRMRRRRGKKDRVRYSRETAVAVAVAICHRFSLPPQKVEATGVIEENKSVSAAKLITYHS